MMLMGLKFGCARSQQANISNIAACREGYMLELSCDSLYLGSLVVSNHLSLREMAMNSAY